MNKKILLFVGLFGYVFLAAFFYWYLYGKPLMGIDDANIYMVYMKNLASGHGFVYNIGGERVEGFTSLLWTLLGAFVYKAFNSFYPLFLINLLFVTFILYRMIHILKLWFQQKDAFYLSVFFFLATVFVVPGYIDWTILTLMETGLWSFALSFSVFNLLEYDYSKKTVNSDIELSFLSGLLIVIRPESLLWVVLLILFRLYQKAIKGKTIKGTFSSLVILGLFPLLVLVGLFFWRYNYFGYWLPNTYYAKVSDGILSNFIYGILYFVKTAYFTPIFLFSFLYCMLAVILVIKSKSLLTHSITLVSTITLLVLYSIPLIVGADHFPQGRFFQPLMPLILLHFIWVTAQFNCIFKNLRIKYFALSMLVVFLFFTPKNRLIDPIIGQGKLMNSTNYGIAKDGREEGYELNEFFKPHSHLPSLGVVVAGGIGLAYQGKVIDFLGLNHTGFAHASNTKNGPAGHGSFDKGVFYTVLPEMMYVYHIHHGWNGLVSIYKSPRYKERTSFIVLQGIVEDAKFKEFYVEVVIRNKDSNSLLHTFFLKEALKNLNPDIYELNYFTNE